MEKLSKADVKKVIRLNDVLDNLKDVPRPYEQITCLTSLKSLCKNELIYREYCRYLFSLAYGNLLDKIEDQELMSLIEEIKQLIQNYSGEESEKRLLWSTSRRLGSYQNDHRRVKSTVVRLINNKDILVIEEIAASLGVDDGRYAQSMIYEATRDYVETYDSSVGTGLTMKSIPMLEKVLAFWNDCC